MKNVLIAVVSVAVLTPGIALATNGYFGHGYGMKAKGRAGVATAMTTDTFGGANNPASMVWVGDRVDVGIDWFSPQRNASRSGSLAGLDGSATSDSEHFFIPELGYNKMLSPGMSLGVTVYGNGGMNTDYPGDSIPAGSPVCGAFNPGGGGGPYNLLCGSGRLGVDLIQLVVARPLPSKSPPTIQSGSRRCLAISVSRPKVCRVSWVSRRTPRALPPTTVSPIAAMTAPTVGAYAWAGWASSPTGSRWARPMPRR